MAGLSEKLLLLCALTAVAIGCKPKIGDDCKLSTDCSAAGDRLCDITAPGGYCTVFNCEPGSCPDGESLCVEFGAQRSTVAACRDDQSPSPYARTFCMATCEKDSDCRGGYRCVDLTNKEENRGAVLIDVNRGHRACLVDVHYDYVPSDTPGDVCKAVLPETSSASGGSAGTGGTSNSDDSSGAGDASGAGQGGHGG